MTSTPVQMQAPPQRSLLRVSGWIALAGLGGAIFYTLFAIQTGMEPSLVGVPVGLMVGQCIYLGSAKQGGRLFQFLALLVAFLAFDLTYAPGMADAALKDGVTPVTFTIFLFLTLISPVIDAQNGFLGQFMVVAGMYLAWKLAGRR